VYDKKFKLTDIAEIINSLDDHKVNVVIEKSGLGKSYCGKNNLQNIDFIGLEAGIKKAYKDLK
jgi:hypothetical protein